MSSRRRAGSTALGALSTGQVAQNTSKPNHFNKLMQQIQEADLGAGNELVAEDDGAIRISDFRITPLGLFGGEHASVKEWDNIGKLLFRFHDSLQIILGDWLVNIERVHGKTYDQIAGETGRKKKTLQNWKYVMSSVDISLRRENLTYKHYMIAAPMSYEKQAHWLGLASQNNWGAGKMQDEIDKEIPPELPESPKLHYSKTVMDKRPAFFARVERLSRAFDGKENPDQQAMREYLDDIESFVSELRKSFGWDEE